jgi:predicted N-formylglutamate amidohydrolase
MFDAVVVTCEHGGNEVPARYEALFAGWESLLQTHRGYDPGALELARRFAASGNWPLHFSTTTRLLCDLNRTVGLPGYFSEITSGLDAATQRDIERDYYQPYRTAVEAEIRRLVMSGRRTLHLSVHTFTPVLDGDVRQADVGLLFDPLRASEAVFCEAWGDILRSQRLDLRVRENYPYRGDTDGFTTSLRLKYSAEQYAGVEIEVNQRWPLEGGEGWRALQEDLVESLQRSLAKVAGR